MTVIQYKYDALQSGLSCTAAQNGNISQVLWRVRGRERQSYALTYDHLDRLKTSTYNNLSDAGTANNSGAWNENLSYDIRGNITPLTRTGKYKSSPTATCWTDGQIDNLSYTYYSSTNRLQKIADAAPAASKAEGWHNTANAASTAQYSYDNNGNMTADPYKGMSVAYNFLNLPHTFTFPNGSTKIIQILYDASGRKLRKTVTDGGTQVYRQDYVGEIEYRTISTVVLSLESIYHKEGRVFNINTGTASPDLLRYEYTIKDHLGNARLNFTDKNGNGKIDITTTPSTNELLSESHYYPYGLIMAGPWIDDLAKDNLYLYNGKEFNGDFGLGWYDYGKRWYDPTITRFWNPDPIIEKFAYLTPFNYASLSPVTKVDLWGLQGEIPMDAAPGQPMFEHDPSEAAKFVEDFKNSPVTQAIMSFIPVLGDANDIKEGYESGNIIQMAAGVIGLIPGGGDAVSGSLKVLNATDAVHDAGKAVDAGKGADAVTPLKIEIDDANKVDRSLLNPPSKPGNAPTFKSDGSSVEIHHEGQKRKGPFKEMHREDHRGKGKDKVNHPNKGQKSEIDRKEFEKARREYWQNQYLQ